MSEWGEIYKSIGAKPVINATGSVTLLGGSTPVKEVKASKPSSNTRRGRETQQVQYQQTLPGQVPAVNV